jgi:predicted unusual protein kinase regulating ubiquinone biosynthesis (AarF/ABC1/UbiB family)
MTCVGIDARQSATPAAGQALPEQLVDDLEAMGPTYVKLGQVLAGRPDLLPDAHLGACHQNNG